MSHFAVMVIGPNVEQQLQPYHEFECTGTNDQYVQDIDITQECREEYESGTKSMVRLADGTLIGRYDDQCYREPTDEEATKIGPMAGSGVGNGMSWLSKDWGDGRGYRTKVHQIPDGAEEVEVPMPQAMTFREFIESWREIKTVPHGDSPDTSDPHKYGYATLNEVGEIERVVRRTNKNKKWDWWVIGGRWSGCLKLKPGAKGEWGQLSWANKDEADDMDRCDAALKGIIDFDGMRDEAGTQAAERWDKAAAAHGGQTWEPWSVVGPRTGYDEAARTAYNEQPAVQALKKAFDNPLHGIDQYLTPRDQYIQQARDSATVLYAFVKDGQWVGQGQMGWFGVSHDDIDQGEWARKVNEMLDALPDDTPITVVDCHI